MTKPGVMGEKKRGAKSSPYKLYYDPCRGGS